MKRQDISGNFATVPAAVIADLRKVFPVNPITPGLPMDQIYYQAGIQHVINFLANVHVKQQET
jgi:hypothetical protein